MIQDQYDSHVWNWRMFRMIQRYSVTLKYLKDHCND